MPIYIPGGGAASADLARVHSAGLGATLSETFPRQAGSANQSMGSGTAYFAAMPFLAGDLVSNLLICVTAAGTSLTLSKLGLYATDGTQLAASADQGTAWQSLGVKAAPMATPYEIPADGVYYGCFFVTSAASPPGLLRAHNATITGGVAASGFPAALATQGSLSDLPSPAVLTATSPISIWMGAS